MEPCWTDRGLPMRCPCSSSRFSLLLPHPPMFAHVCILELYRVLLLLCTEHSLWHKRGSLNTDSHSVHHC